MLIDAFILVLYLLLYRGLTQLAREENELRRVRQARKRSLKTLVAFVPAMALCYMIVKFVASPPVFWFCLYSLYFGLFTAILTLFSGLLQQSVTIRVGKAKMTDTKNGG